MGQAAHDAAHGAMDVADQRQTFHGFLIASLWGSALIAMYLALFTLAFAIGSGWFPGLLAFAAVGVVVGLVFKMSGAWWALLVAQVVLLGLGGAVIPAFAGMMG